MSTTATASSSSRTVAPSRPRRNPARTVRHRAGPRRPTGPEYRSLQSRRVTKDDLHDFQRTSFTWEGTRHDVFRRGSGRAVLVMSEIPGITPNVANFARRVCDRGLTAVVPQLLGVPGKAWTWPYVIRMMAWTCVSREFVSFATGRTSPATLWLRALAGEEHERCGGPAAPASAWWDVPHRWFRSGDDGRRGRPRCCSQPARPADRHHRRRDRRLAGQPLRAAPDCPLGAHRGLRRRAGASHPAGPGPGAGS